jgi:hypothetical protein
MLLRVSTILTAALVLAAPVSAQRLMDAARLAPLLNRMASNQHAPLQCDVQPLKPHINYGFRFQAGYTFSVPMKQYLGTGHGWVVVTEITPDSGDRQPRYLLDVMRLPPVPANIADARAGGSYLLGEGRYHIKWMLLDDQERICRREWNIQARLDRSARSVKVAIPPGVISGLSLRGAPKANPDAIVPLRLTILLDAAPLVSFRRTSRALISPGDQALLLGMLSAFLERVPCSSLRLVAFNLEQPKEVFRQDDFSLNSLDRLRAALNRVSLATVDVATLQEHKGHLDLLAGMINQELRDERRPDAVVFFGPRERYEDKLPDGVLDETPLSGAPQFFYFQWRPRLPPGIGLEGAPNDASLRTPQSPVGDGIGWTTPVPPRKGPGVAVGNGPVIGDFPDSVSYAVDRVKGETYRIHTPAEFSKAIDRLERQVSRVKPPAN